jgi:hypothetical protein
MRPVPPCAATARVDAAVPSALASLQGFQPSLSSAGLRSVSTPAARTCRRTQPLWGRTGSGAMTAALVIVPADPAWPASASAQRGRCPGSTVEPREVQTGAPWMVRLSMGSANVMLRVTSAARIAPARKHLLGSRP